MIEVKRIREGAAFEFEVLVREGHDQTRHRVSMTNDTYKRLAAGRHAPELLIEGAFKFLLEREPKESILPRFDLAVIPRYFPDFERHLPSYLPPV